MNSKFIYEQVQDHYGSVARANKPLNSSSIAKAFGYTEEELNSIPREANLGLSCGNPLGIASLREGETVIDFGSGAGFDVFLAAKKVGLKGQAIGVDMNKDMLTRARNNHAKSGNLGNISFIEGKITFVPIEDGIADCIISNCVINLVPEAEKPAVFAEMARLLKPGGRVAISDILARKPFPTELRESITAYVGCVAGCSLKQDYERFLAESGFREIVLVDTQSDLNVYIDMTKKDQNGNAASCCDPSPGEAASESAQKPPCCSEKQEQNCCLNNSKEAINSENTRDTSTLTGAKAYCSGPSSKAERDAILSRNLDDIDINQWAGSYKIFAVKT